MELGVLSLRTFALMPLVACCATPPASRAPAPAPVATAEATADAGMVAADAGTETGTETGTEAETATGAATETGADAGVATAHELPTDTTVLHIGDSMAGALGVALNEEFKRHGIKGVLRFKTASFIPTWAWSKELPLYLAHHKPDLVLITLGTNETQMHDPTLRAGAIQKLVKQLDGRPCVWILPPEWGPGDRGLMPVIRANTAPCRILETAELYPDMPRLGDKIHPTMGARKVWAERVVEWLRRERRPTADRPWQLAPRPAAQ